jgi:hypothetical protein
MSTHQDAAVVDRYVRYLQQRASACDDLSDDAIFDHEAEVLWALARAICGEGLVAHVSVLRRASLDLLERGGRRLCGDAEPPSATASSRDSDEAAALKDLGRALLELRARFQLAQ